MGSRRIELRWLKGRLSRQTFENLALVSDITQLIGIIISVAIGIWHIWRHH